MSRESALNFDKWTNFSENYEPVPVIMACLQIYRELLYVLLLYKYNEKYPTPLDKINILT